MNVSDSGVDFIKNFEGLRLTAYTDIAGILTIGYGHTGKDVTLGKVITEKEAEELLRKDLESFSTFVSVFFGENFLPYEHDALVSFFFNVGTSSIDRIQNPFTGFAASRLKDAVYKFPLNHLRRAQAKVGFTEAMLRWNKAKVQGKLKIVKGLDLRRKSEVKLFLTGNYE